MRAWRAASRMRDPRRRAVAVALLAALAAAGCDRTVVTDVRGTRIAGTDVRGLIFGWTTPAEIEHRFGEPAARGPDGALTYRYSTVRRSERRVAGFAIPISNQVREHTVTFRFTGGVLSRICRARS